MGHIAGGDTPLAYNGGHDIVNSPIIPLHNAMCTKRALDCSMTFPYVLMVDVWSFVPCCFVCYFEQEKHGGNSLTTCMRATTLAASLLAHTLLPDSSDTEPGDMPGKLTSVNSTSPLALPSTQEPFGQQTICTDDQEANTIFRHQCLNEGENCELTYSIYMYRIVVVCD